MNCPNCKSPINDNAAVCEWCGSSIKIEIENSLSELDKELLSMAAQKLDAVKLYRKKTGLGLKESKDYVDNLFATHLNVKKGCLSVLLIVFTISTVTSIITSLIF
ncbi:MAG: ribosomal protein L7/L12 [Prevotellaceae bacterium]|jgi:ribosomal protein L7/L12|nr:ribosomal protein L7/L12 [Prevotellaceae bacterium]